MASNVIPFPRRHANDNIIDTPPQPGLSAFIVFDEVPAGCIVQEVLGNRIAPFLRNGDFAIVDTSDREPTSGELYLRATAGGMVEFVEINQFDTSRITQPGGAPFTEPLWAAYWTNTVASGDGTARRVRWFDGPCRTQAMAAQLIGKVVGLYQPDFRQQLRLAA